MSLVINTNTAATLASSNLASSNALLSRSLNRLSSGSKIVNPSDDAGGLAVSMKLSAAARRQGAVAGNLGNTTSYLQTQDGALKLAGKVIERIGELKTLALDPTKNASDLANYNTEFTALRAQLSSLGQEKFNGVALFGSSTLNVATTGDGTESLNISGVNLLGSAAFEPFVDNFANLSNWTTQVIGGAGGPSVNASGNALVLNGATGAVVSATGNDSFSGDFDLTLDFNNSGTGNVFQVSMGGQSLFTSVNMGGNHSLRISYANGVANAYLDGSSTPSNTINNSSLSGPIKLESIGGVNAVVNVQNFNVTSGSVSGGVSSIANGASLSALQFSDLTDALQSIATFRATNGSLQSRIGFANELLSVNKANLEAAVSRITDVDVAQESTQLARFNTLVQAGTAMLAQANQSSQSALRLLS